MKYCKYCKVLNDEELVYCKICGRKLEENKITKKESKTQRKTKHNTKHNTKHKTKTKTKNKTIVKDNREKGKMNFFQKFIMLFLFLLCTSLIGVIGFLAYHIYQTENIDVPNVVGYTYSDASSTLKDNKLNSTKVEEKVTDASKVGIVLSQSKKAGSKVKENQIIKLTVGVLDDSVTVPNVKGLKLTEAIALLNKNKVKYKITYKTSDEDGIVLNQSISQGKKISIDNVITLTVSKKNEEIVKETDTKKEEKTEKENTDKANNNDQKENKQE